MSYLLDADVVSNMNRTVPNNGVARWFADTPAEHLHLSVLTVGEIRKGLVKLRNRGDWRQAQGLERKFSETVKAFGTRIVPVTVDVAEEWASQPVHRAGMVVDGLVAATAAVHRLTVVTRNVKHFEHTGVPLLNPFSD